MDRPLPLIDNRIFFSGSCSFSPHLKLRVFPCTEKRENLVSITARLLTLRGRIPSERLITLGLNKEASA